MLVIIAFTTRHSWGKNQPTSLKNILDEAVQINFIKFEPLVHFLIFCVMKWDIYIKHLGYKPKYGCYLKEKKKAYERLSCKLNFANSAYGVS